MRARTTRKITPVIVRCKKQAEKVDRLVEYCRELDGTIIHVIHAETDNIVINPHTHGAAVAGLQNFLQAAREFAGRPFFWMEVDSIPLKAGWLAAISREYYRSKKHFLLPLECASNHLVTGIGVHGPLAAEIISDKFEGTGWDLWITTMLPHMCHFSPLIQNQYCAEWDEHKHIVRENQFPRDQKIIRPDAMVFHADKWQSLIKPLDHEPEGARGTSDFDLPVYRHAGDIGDIIAVLPAIRQLGRGNLLVCNSITDVPGLCSRESLKGKRFEALFPLLAVQEYLTNVAWSDENIVSTDAAWSFRATLQFGESLAHAQARRLGIDSNTLNTSPWLKVPGPRVPNGRIIVSRSPRYNMPFWSEKIWPAVGKAYGEKVLFIGLKEEHAAMEATMGRKIEWAQTPDYLEIARLMRGAEMVYCNQSSPCWVAFGVGARVIQETDPERPNSVITDNPKSFFTGRPNQQHMVFNSLSKLSR